RFSRDWSSDVCSSDLLEIDAIAFVNFGQSSSVKLRRGLRILIELIPAVALMALFNSCFFDISRENMMDTCSFAACNARFKAKAVLPTLGLAPITMKSES